MNQLPLYSYFKIWKDSQERTWTEPYYSREPSLARRSHAEAKRFAWAVAGQFHRTVTDLTAHDGARVATVEEGADERDVNRTDAYYQR